MPVMTRRRTKKPQSEAMKPSPNGKKLKQAVKKMKAEKEQKRKEAEAKEKTLKTPSPKPILKASEDGFGMWGKLDTNIYKYIFGSLIYQAHSNYL